MAKIVISTFGSLGDIHPYIALALELKNRGHEVVVATCPDYNNIILKYGLLFSPVRPNMPTDKKLLKDGTDLKSGSETIVNKWVMPHIEDAVHDLLKAVENADLLINHSFCYAGPIVAAKSRIPWVSTTLSPSATWSAYDPSVVALNKFMYKVPDYGFLVNKILYSIIQKSTKKWAYPIYNLRKKLGLPKGKNPILEGKRSPNLCLAMFSEELASKQKDWPNHMYITGFSFLNNPFIQIDNDLEKFIESGKPPIVFTLGSLLPELHADSFYTDTFDIMCKLQQRSILLVGNNVKKFLDKKVPSHIYIAEYAELSLILKRSLFVVHHGGIGSTSEALRAGCPMLIIPFCHDQPDNAFRLEKLGVAKVLFKVNFSKLDFEKKIVNMLEDKHIYNTARNLSQRILVENGSLKAGDMIEQFLLNVKNKTV